MYKYAIEIFYSEEERGYIAVVPELPGCSAFGATEEEQDRPTVAFPSALLRMKGWGTKMFSTPTERWNSVKM